MALLNLIGRVIVLNSITVWENAYDSIEHGLDHLEEAVKKDNPYDYKRAVLDFCHAAELLLKEILFRENPIYVFDKNDLFKKCKDPQKPTIEELYNCKSLEVSALCDTIKKYAPNFRVNLSIFSAEASKLRNKIQHFCYAAKNDEVRALLLKLSYQLLCPAFSYLDTSKSYEPIQKRLYEIFSLDEILDHEKTQLNKDNKEYEIGVCFACGSYGLFIEYNGESYPQECHCVACTYSKSNIHIDEYHECPECGGNSLIYCNELDGGICLLYKCANHRDGGILTPMEWCYECQDYRIEEKCICNKAEEDEE